VFPFEGGILPEEVRNRKYDCLASNPPYTHLRNLGNRRYAAYPRQRDMAQVFVRWALDHVTENGVVSLNIIDTWLNVKLCDGAIETRNLISSKLAEIVISDEIRRYSENLLGVGGGDIPTFILCLSNNTIADKFVMNGKFCILDLDQLQSAGFISSLSEKKYSFRNVPTTKYLSLQGFRSANKHGSKTKSLKGVFV
jgi:methylase of polypeptide subunit release factors